MTDPYHYDDQFLVQALRMNWEHARHIETQRLYCLAVYVTTAAGLAFGALTSGDYYVKLGASVCGLMLTFPFWGLTHKFNNAIRIQISRADDCARRLILQTADKRGPIPLHAFLGFPRKLRPPFSMINVRRMFEVVYGTCATGWLLFCCYLVFRLVVPTMIL